MPLYAQIGIGGHRIVDVYPGQKAQPLFHDLHCMELFESVPFITRFIHAGKGDLTEEERKPYALRRTWRWRGEEVVSYFAKLVEQRAPDDYFLKVTQQEFTHVADYVKAKRGYPVGGILISELGLSTGIVFTQTDGWAGMAIQEYKDDVSRHPINVLSSNGDYVFDLGSMVRKARFPSNAG